jgi:ectoine hydroxylase-related dioxygenase (phytanoyl-CoA dioxygenase family)
VTLSAKQIAQYRADGFLLVEDAVDAKLLQALRADFDNWVVESCQHDAPYGSTINDRPRFDVEPGHCAERPALRRVNAPIEVSDAYYAATVNSRMTDIVADLVGPNVKLHHTKINSKLPGAATAVKWHQDFTFTPHTNDDVVTALLMIDEVTLDNGPLEVAPGSHRGELHSLWHDGRFTGAVDDRIAARFTEQAVSVIGPPGAVCLMHSRLAHGSAPNCSSMPRTLHISVFSAEDAVPCSPSPMPNRFEGLLVRGARTGKVRSIPFEMELPELPRTASFFDQQASTD